MKRWVGIFEAEEKCDDCSEVHEGECAEEVTEATEATTYTVTYKDSKKPGKTFSTKVKATSVAGAKSAFGEWDENNRFSYVSAKANEVKEVKEAEEKQAPAKKSEREVELPSGAKVKATTVKGWQSQKGDKEANKERKATYKESKLDECGDMMGGMAEEAESGMSINTNVDTRTGKKTVSVNADGAAADQLMQMLKMAGMGGHSEEAEAGPEMMQAQPSMADHIKVISVPLAHQDGGFDFGAAGQEEEVEEEYANEPNTQTQPVDTQLRQGNDLNREKTQHKHSYRQGDNPMAMREAAELAQLEKSLFEELATIKITKAK